MQMRAGLLGGTTMTDVLSAMLAGILTGLVTGAALSATIRNERYERRLASLEEVIPKIADIASELLVRLRSGEFGGVAELRADPSVERLQTALWVASHHARRAPKSGLPAFLRAMRLRLERAIDRPADDWEAIEGRLVEVLTTLRAGLKDWLTAPSFNPTPHLVPGRPDARQYVLPNDMPLSRGDRLLLGACFSTGIAIGTLPIAIAAALRHGDQTTIETVAVALVGLAVFTAILSVFFMERGLALLVRSLCLGVLVSAVVGWGVSLAF